MRILKDQTYSKSYTGNFSNILYVITEREYKTGVPVYKLKELLTDESLIGTFYSAELKPVEIDRTKLPKVSKIYGIRLHNDTQEVQVSLNNEKKRQWLEYDSLIPYI